MDNLSVITLKHNDLKFHAYTGGVGPIVLCVHGFPDNSRSFRFQAQPLIDAGYRVVMPLTRGYEKSSQPINKDYRLEVLGRDIIAWIEDLGGEKVHLIGHDWGAAASYVAAALAPEKLLSLTTIAVPHPAKFSQIGMAKVPVQLLKSWYMLFFQLPGFSDYFVQRNDWALLKFLWKRWSPGFSLEENEWKHLTDTFEEKNVLNAMLNYYRQNVSPSILLNLKKSMMNTLSEVPVSTLAITGKNDGCIDTRLYDHVFLKEDFPKGIRIEKLDGVGHFAHQENPPLVNALILEWLGLHSTI